MSAALAVPTSVALRIRAAANLLQILVKQLKKLIPAIANTLFVGNWIASELTL